MSEIVVAGHTYRVGRLNPLQALHVSRRVAPVIAAMGVSIAALAAGAKLAPEDVAVNLGPVSEVVSNMTDEHVEYVLTVCLSVVLRKQGDKWAPVANGAMPMFQDVGMPEMMRLVVAVLQENLGDFFRGLGDTPQSQSS